MEANDFRCYNTGACIRQVKVCDGIAHCSDGSDETNCSMYISILILYVLTPMCVLINIVLFPGEPWVQIHKLSNWWKIRSTQDNASCCYEFLS